MSIVQLIDAHDHEIAHLRREHANKIISETTENGMAARAIERNAVIVEKIVEQSRALAFRAGLPYKPQQQYGEAVVIGEGGA